MALDLTRLRGPDPPLRLSPEPLAWLARDLPTRHGTLLRQDYLALHGGSRAAVVPLRRNHSGGAVNACAQPVQVDRWTLPAPSFSHDKIIIRVNFLSSDNM